MGKARSSRRMRNCKSRNKRGGRYSGFQSDLLTSFKSAVRHGVTSPSYQTFDASPTVELDDDMKKQIDDNLLNYDKYGNQILKKFVIKNDNDNGLNRCDSKNVEKLKSQINVESPKRKAYYLYALDKICEAHAKQEKKEEPKTNQGVTSHLAPFGIGHGEESSGRLPVLEGDTQHTPTPPQRNKYNDFGHLPKHKTTSSLDMSAYEQHQGFTQTDNPAYMPPPPPPPFYDPRKGGGKSRRRHRRGRTLHKRRKSSKVRKMRYSRTRR